MKNIQVAADEKYPKKAARSLCKIGISVINFSATTFNDSCIKTEDEWYNNSEKWHRILLTIF